MEISVSETTPGPSGIKTEPKEEDCEDLLSAFMVEPPPVKIENDDSSENDEYGSLSEDYKVDIKKLKTEQSDDSKEWLKNYRIKSEENDQLPVSGEDQDDDFTEDNNIKSEEMHIKEDDGIDEPGMKPNSYNQDAQEKRRTTKKIQPVFQCPDCDFNTTRKRDMRGHVVRYHKKHAPREDGFKCTKCDYTSTKKDVLNAHLLRHIRSEQATEYICDICEYTTLFKGRMERHLLAHTKKGGLAPQTMFECNQCSFKTKYKPALTAHSLVRHENPENLTKYGCSECDYTTLQKWRLKYHSLVHGKPKDVPVLKCYHCSYETLRKNNLKSHLQRRHMQKSEKTLLFEEYLRLNCDSQNAENKQVSVINLAESVDNYKFRCQDCEYKTNWSSSYTIHLKQHETPKNKRKRKSC